MSNKRCLIAVAIFVTILTAAQCTWAASGTWTAGGQTAIPVDNTWANIGTAPDYATGNWAGGVEAYGTDSTATFNLDVAAGVPQPIDLSNTVTIGSMVFGDTNTATPGGWVINNIVDPYVGIIFLSVTTTNTPPLSTITVNDLGVGAEVKINAQVWGSTLTDGLIKAGVGTLNLAQPTTYTGGTVVNAGTLKLTAGNNTLDTTGPITVSNTTVNGATVNGTLDLGGSSQTTSGAIVLDGNLQNGTLVNTGVDNSTGTPVGINYDARSGAISANLTEDTVNAQPVGLTKTTGGTMILSGTNTYSGGTIISGGNLQFDSPAALPATGQITINAQSALNATGAYATAQAWLNSGRIVNTSAGVLALTADEGAINLAGYANLSLGAVGNVSYTGAITPAGNIYYLGGGGGTLTIAGTNALTDNGGTPRSLIVNGPGTLALTGNNSFTGGTTLTNGILRVGNDASLGGPNTQLTLNGGLLEITGSGLTLDNRNVNWSTFNGGFYIDDGVTFTLGVNVPNGVEILKQGPGTLNIAGGYTYNVTNGIALDSGTVSVKAGATLSAGLSMDFVNNSQTGHIIVGEAGSNLPTTLSVTGGNAGQYTGYFKLGGGTGSSAVCVADIYGNATTFSTVAGVNFISMGEWGNAQSTINMYDGATLNTGTLYIGHWNSTVGIVNLNNSSKVEAGQVSAGGQATGTLNVKDTSLVATNYLLVSDLGGPGNLNIGDHATVYAGQMEVGRDDYWMNNPAIATINGNAQVHVTTNATMADGYSVSGSGDLYVGRYAWSNGTLNINGNAQVTVDGNVRVGYDQSSRGWLNIGGNAIVNIGTAMTIDETGTVWDGTGRMITISDNAQVTVPIVKLNDPGWNTNVIGVLTLNGGTLNTGAIASLNTGTGTVIFNGGTLKATGDSTTFMQGLRAATIQAGGAIIDTNGHNITIAQILNEAVVNTGNLTKQGSGTLTLAGALHYQGLTDIQAGTVDIGTGVATQIGNVGGAGTMDVENATSLSAFSVNVGNVTIGGASSLTTANVYTNTLTISAGSTLTITAIPGGPLAGGGLTAVPEPSTIAMLAMAALGLMAAAWRRRK
ncbi:MAG: autotransporter-associated beta strand repeat-containing protein [Thermoguttaceae bacterium]|jgi:autotransporter-associated beta strand protein